MMRSRSPPADSTSCLNLASLADAKTKFGELPAPTLARKVDVVVPEADADDQYDYNYGKAHIGRPRGGVIWLGALTLASPFVLHRNMTVEKS